jgi:predicted lactoylglutathione lyase
VLGAVQQRRRAKLGPVGPIKSPNAVKLAFHYSSACGILSRHPPRRPHEQANLRQPAGQDLPKSREFFSALGYTFNPEFSSEKGACMVIADGSIYAMLLTEPFFKTFVDKPIVRAKEATEVLVAKAVAAGGRAPRAAQDHGFMYAHGFEDIDGHVWELVWMAPQPE